MHVSFQKIISIFGRKLVMKKILVSVISALIAGCTVHTEPPKTCTTKSLQELQTEADVDHALKGLHSYKAKSKATTTQEWFSDAVMRVQSKFYDADLYRGRNCDLVMNLDDDGNVLSVNSKGGDPMLCHAAIAAVKKASFSPLPENTPHEIPMRFMPK